MRLVDGESTTPQHKTHLLATPFLCLLAPPSLPQPHLQYFKTIHPLQRGESYRKKSNCKAPIWFGTCSHLNCCKLHVRVWQRPSVCKLVQAVILPPLLPLLPSISFQVACELDLQPAIPHTNEDISLHSLSKCAIYVIHRIGHWTYDRMEDNKLMLIIFGGREKYC